MRDLRVLARRLGAGGDVKCFRSLVRLENTSGKILKTILYFIIFLFTALYTTRIIKKNYSPPPKKNVACSLGEGTVHLWLVYIVQHSTENLKQ